MDHKRPIILNKMDLKDVCILNNLYLISNKQANKNRNILPYIQLKLENDVLLFGNLPEYYRKSDGATKKKIPGCIFDEKLV